MVLYILVVAVGNLLGPAIVLFLKSVALSILLGSTSHCAVTVDKGWCSVSVYYNVKVVGHEEQNSCASCACVLISLACVVCVEICSNYIELRVFRPAVMSICCISSGVITCLNTLVNLY
ncbi:hypothetical protein AVEN_207699-1 [Araneus ventricosus]|uniref:Uncharacterized protein n=1 Tax=Araneus ventricosus TaxID=182803 RepID=A0A4Y2PDX9_ARAVE|nr:hypothetical protein AVEN_207699-1 [Araneus ventricosus]